MFDEITSIALIDSGKLIRCHGDSAASPAYHLTLTLQQRVGFTGPMAAEKLGYDTSVLYDPSTNKAADRTPSAPIVYGAGSTLKRVDRHTGWTVYLYADKDNAWIDLWKSAPMLAAFVRRFEMKGKRLLIEDLLESRGWNEQGTHYTFTTCDVVTKESIEKSGFEFREHWGERFEDVRQTSINVLNVCTLELASFGALAGFDAGQGIYSSKQDCVYYIAYSTTPQRYGLVYCQNRSSELCRYCLKGGTTVSLISSGHAVRSPMLNKDESALVVLSNSAHGAHAKTASLLLLDIASGSIRTVVDGGLECTAAFIQAAKIPKQAWTDHLVLMSHKACRQVLLDVSMATGAVRYIQSPLPDASVVLLDICDKLVLGYATFCNLPWSIVVGRIGEEGLGELRLVEGLASPQLDWQAHIYRDPTNPLLEAVISTPPETRSKHPVVFIIHGGPHAAYTTEFAPSMWCIQAVLVNAGYAVVGINYIGSLGYGESAINQLLGRYGDLDISSSKQLIDGVLLKYGDRLDASRTFLYGGSHGGFLTAWLIGRHPSTFRAAMLINPVTDYYNLILGGSGLSFDAALEESLAVNLFHRSPITLAHEVTIPILLMLGSSDLRVPPSQGLAWYHRLPKDTEKTVKWFPGDNHALSLPSSERCIFETVLDFLARHAA